MGRSKVQLYLALSSYLVGNLSSGIFMFILSVHILQVTGSSVAFSMILLLNPVALLLSSPVVGEIVDRHQRKAVVIVAQSTSILVVLGAIALFKVVSSSLGQVVVAGSLVFLLTVCDNFQKVAYKSATVNLVDKQDYQSLIAGEQLVSALMMLVAPVLGGFLYPILSLTQAILLEAVGEAAVIVLLLRLSFTAFGQEFVPEAENATWHGFSQGSKYIRQDQVLVSLLFFGVLANLALTAVIIGEPVVLLQQLHISTRIYGWVEASLAIGMLLGSTIVGVLRVKADKRRYTAKVGLLITGVFWFLAISGALQQKFWIGLIFALGLGALGCAICLANLPYTLHMRTEVDVQKQGRINATADAIVSVASPFGMALFGFLFRFLPASMIFLVAGAVMLVASVKLFHESSGKAN